MMRYSVSQMHPERVVSDMKETCAGYMGYEEWVQIQIHVFIPPLPPWVKLTQIPVLDVTDVEFSQLATAPRSMGKRKRRARARP